MNESGKFQESLGEYDSILSREFAREDIPLKVRKTELLRGAGLPIPETEYCSRESVSEIGSMLEARFEKSGAPLILRVACIPDRMSMPTFRINSPEEIENAVSGLHELLDENKQIQQIIIQDVTPVDKISDKISGRIFLGSDQATSETIELYKGARHTSILNKADLSDANYLRIEKVPGEFAKTVKPIDPKGNLQQGEVNEILGKLAEMDESIRLVEHVVEKSSEHDGGVTLEFSYRSGRLSFIDVD